MSNLFHIESGKGQPVLFIHGFCESHEIWDGFIDQFQNRIISIDLPGFGKSPLLPSPFTIDDVARAVGEWCLKNSLSDIILIGHSLGGYVALAMAEQDPSLFAGLSLFHSTALADTEEKKSGRNKTIEFVKKNGVAPFIDTFSPGLFFDKKHPGIALSKKLGNQTSVETLVSYTQAMRDRPDRTSLLKSFTKPVLILAGDHDTLIPLKSLEEQVTFLKKPTFIALSQSAHMGFLEEPTASASAIRTFINTCSTFNT